MTFLSLLHGTMFPAHLLSAMFSMLYWLSYIPHARLQIYILLNISTMHAVHKSWQVKAIKKIYTMYFAALARCLRLEFKISMLNTKELGWAGLVLFNDTGLVSVSTLVSCMTILFLKLQITRSDIRPHIKWAVSLQLHMVIMTLIFLRGSCGYVWVNILALSPEGLMD